METLHIHTEVEDLKFFSDKNGVSAYSDRVVSYAMQGSNVVGIFYNNSQAVYFYENNKYTKALNPIYFWDEVRWNNRKL